MKDKLKQFVDENREAFDSESPNPAIFTKLQRQLKTGEKFGKFHFLRTYGVAAAIAFLIIVVGLSYFIVQKNSHKDPIVGTPVPVRMDNDAAAGINDPVYARQIDHYQELIGLQQTELKKLQVDHPDLYRQFSSDINRLDSAYQALKTTLDENPNTEVLLEAMLQNLQLQSDLLNRQLRIIKEIKQKSKT